MMSFIAPLIPVTQKASNVCAYCRVRKQRCDRTLPQCVRCASKGRNCDYTPYKEPARHETNDPGPLVDHKEGCTHADLSHRGTTDVLQTFNACINNPNSLELVTRLSDMVYDILDLADINLPKALGEFGPCIQQWCPIIPEDILRGGFNDLSQDMRRTPGAGRSLLRLGLWLVSRRPCSHCGQVPQSGLYRTMKQIQALLQCRSELSLEAFQISMMIAVHETGHGLQAQAFQTLSSGAALLRMLDLDARKSKIVGQIDTIEWMKVSMLMLDRMIPISMPVESLPLIVSSVDSISKHVAQAVGPSIPPPSPRPYASSPRKVHIRAAVSLASGHVLEYIHAIHQKLTPEETYDQVDEIINQCIKLLVDKPQPHTWLHCDAIAMAFCSHILLQASQIRHIVNTTNGSNNFVSPAAGYTKAHLALKYSRRMAWDMVHVAIEKISSEAEIPHLPFAGLCCVFRAGLAVFETKKYVDEDVMGEQDIQGFRKILEWFAARWNIGEHFLARLEDLIRHDTR
ncbi:hypothetical protein FB567DRAFT_119104 [Paraphoma chrysanthemicola]|uniref:Zn(2)-C6 fungal-type domain-containing protein n=1 Tax=Paraphoma chrysanthemicola TaxID=798071 RepID=A0A8K0R2Z8_9PLEO|nr:hypothetical protein FB567DRAFT_119104 [Paraphoma chrysanthemicola]